MLLQYDIAYKFHKFYYGIIYVTMYHASMSFDVQSSNLNRLFFIRSCLKDVNLKLWFWGYKVQTIWYVSIWIASKFSIGVRIYGLLCMSYKASKLFVQEIGEPLLCIFLHCAHLHQWSSLVHLWSPFQFHCPDNYFAFAYHRFDICDLQH